MTFKNTKPITGLRAPGPVFILFLIIAVSGCGRKGVSSSEYLNYLSEDKNGLVQHQSANGVHFTLRHDPVDFLIIKQYGSLENIADLQRARKEYGDLLYFTLTISNEKNVHPLKYQANGQEGEGQDQRSNYYAFGAETDISLVSGTDTVPCAMYHFERNYGIKPEINLLLAFDVPGHAKGDVRVLYRDRAFNTGPLSFLFTKKAFNHIPNL